MTYKSFTTLNELFDLLVQRFYIQPPEGLKPVELDEWKKEKQMVIQMRYVLYLKMVLDLLLILRFQRTQHIQGYAG